MGRTSAKKQRIARLRRQQRASRSMLNAKNPTVSVIIPVMNERKTIARVVRHARAVHPNTEVIVVANGSTDGTDKLARRAGAKVLVYSEPLGHDVGRSIGARQAKGRILLFTDGDIVIPAEQLKPLVKAVEQGVDVALNKYTGPIHRKNVHNVILAKHAMNTLLSRSDLGGASMTTIPHALSRHALEVIGTEHLCVPPKAMALAIMRGLELQAVHHIDVGKTNRRRRRIQGKNPLEELIIGDHLEALHFAMLELGKRCGYSDLSRRRELVR